MLNSRSWRKSRFFVGANGLAFLLVCGSAIRTGSFELRVLSESLAAVYLILLTAFGWFSNAALGKRILGLLVGIALVVIACRFVLKDGFASWFESAIWYIPVTSTVCATMHLAGLRIQECAARRSQSFSIRALLIMTAVIAILFPLVSLMKSSRASGNWLWLSDTLVMVTPVVLTAIGLLWSVLNEKRIYAGILLLGSPVFGILICQIYDWNDYNTMVRLTISVAVITTLIAWHLRRQGIRFVTEVASPNRT